MWYYSLQQGYLSHWNALPTNYRKVNTSPGTIDGVDLKKPLVTPLIKKIDLQFPTGIEVTARNMKGVTIRDALDAIHKQLKKKV
jgi:hypothetical protein